MAILENVKGSPDPLAPFEEKITPEYGLKIARTITGDWIGNDGILTKESNCNFISRRNYIRENRLYVRGEQDLSYYKNLIKGDNDLNLFNLDFSIINIPEKFCRIVSNGITEENYRLEIRANDRITAKIKKDKEDKYLRDMYTLPMLKKAKEVLNVDLVPKGYVPEDEEELRLFLEIKDKPKIEIAEEILIDFIKKNSDWDFIVRQGNKDLVDNGIISCRVYTDKNDGVKLAYVDPENYIHSVVRKNDFSDKNYEGVIDTITLSDYQRESGCTDSELRELAKKYAIRNSSFGNVQDYNRVSLSNIIDYKIDVLRFAFKTSKKIVFKGKKRAGKVVKVSIKSDSYSDIDAEDFKITSKVLDTWIEGNYVIGTNAIYGYKECENIARDVMNKAMSPFIVFAYDIYENRLQSFLTKIKPLSDQMQLQHLKLQHLLSELTPDVKEIDLDMLAELDDKGDKSKTWKTALKLLGAKGVVFKKRIDFGENGIKEASAIKTNPSGQGSAIVNLLNAWAHYYNLIRDITGINPAADGSMQHDALVGINRLAQLAANTATKHITDTAVAFYLKVDEVISSRLKGIFSFNEASHIREVYEQVVGKQLLDSVEILKDRSLNEFGFVYEMLPTSQQMQDFKDDLTIALQEGSIDVEVKSEAVRIARTNVKLATEYIFFHRRKRQKQQMEEQMALSKNKSQNDALAAQAKVKADTDAYSIKKQIDLQYKSQEAQIEVMKEKALQELRQPIEDKNFEQELYLEQIRSLGKYKFENFKEDRKDERTKIQASQQSKILDQRNKNTNPIDFKNEIDFNDQYFK